MPGLTELPADALIRALTLTHPWAYCIAFAGKNVENRTWSPERQGGRVGMYLALHGGAVPGLNTEKRRQARRDLARALGIMQETGVYASTPEGRAPLAEGRFMIGEDRFFTPGIVAVARLSSVVRDSASPWAEWNRYHWTLEDVTVLPQAIACTGAQGLWTPKPDVLAEIRRGWQQAKTGPRA